MRSLLFCNEMLGLGHLRRSLVLAEALVADDEQATALVVTGSPAFGGMPIPPRVDVLKLPTSPLESRSSWSATTRRPPSHLALSSGQVSGLRSRLSLAAATALRPDGVVVDYRPLGRNDELRPTLEWLKRDGHSTVALGLWEVDDADERLMRDWTPDVFAAVRELYDLALIYGPSSAGDLRIDGLRGAGVPVHNTGLVAAPPAPDGPADIERGYLLASTGGGVDGFAVLEAVIDAVRLAPLGRLALLVTGPLMPPEDVEQLRKNAAGLEVRIERFRADMPQLLAGARAVVSMAGYCTVAEVLASGKPALLIPRTSPREEQLNRARRFAAAGRVEMLAPAELEPTQLRPVIERLLARAPTERAQASGAADAANLLATAAESRAEMTG
jgi:predicted glycosyltransferase